MYNHHDAKSTVEKNTKKDMLNFVESVEELHLEKVVENIPVPKEIILELQPAFSKKDADWFYMEKRN